MNGTPSAANMIRKVFSRLCLMLLLAVLLPASVFAAEQGKKTVRVGWFESPFNMTDSFGGRSGFSYEYQQKIAAYTGWEYEYVSAGWPELLQMLQRGEIDLLSDVSYTEERAQNMLYSALPMGEEEYYVFVAGNNTAINGGNYASFNGKRAGIKVFYQPKYDIQSEPPRLASAEALVRWQHPELGLVPPNDFIPLFEGNGQISVVDNYVWAETARQIAAWKEKFGVVLPVSVNLSRVDMFDPKLEEILDGLVDGNGLTCKDLKLEVTESACTDNAEELLKVMNHLRAKGYEIEMDDFGSGYSSLNMLSSMPVDVLKMDRGFIKNIEHSAQDFRLVELILDIAKNLKMPVIAEGVETENQLTMLKNAGCDFVQGYYFSRPVPPEEFEKFIAKNH